MSIIINSDRLRVEIAEPGIAPNTTIRFDRAGFITQVTLDGKHDFCTHEPDNLAHPSSGGYGLCNEMSFVDDVAPLVKVGEKFPKMGSGLLTKDEDIPYIFHHAYECEQYDISTESTESSVTFDTQPKPCLGYAISQTKKIEVSGNELTMTISVRNVGEKPLHFEDYCHNFITIDHLKLSADYNLSMPVAAQDSKKRTLGGALIGKGSGFTFTEYSNESNLMEIPSSEIEQKAPFIWKLTNKNSPATISEIVSAIPYSIKVWAIDHIISPEIICRFSVAPGESCTWSRKWIFDC
ncbi:MAG: hypothetical protein ACI3VB_04305 [Oscillospiraceae bacterium]